jgi:DNA-binding GntR family transcriptional regulator
MLAAPMSDPIPFDIQRAREVFETFGALQAEAARKGVPKLTAEAIERLRAWEEERSTALEQGRVEDAIAADDAFHGVLVDAAGDPDIVASIALILPRVRRMDLWLFSRMSLGARRPVNAHTRIIDACERGDAEAAAEIIERSFRDAGELLADAAGA